MLGQSHRRQCEEVQLVDVEPSKPARDVDLLHREEPSVQHSPAEEVSVDLEGGPAGRALPVRCQILVLGVAINVCVPNASLQRK